MNGQYMSGVIDVETPPDGHNTLKGMLCRRRAERMPLPVEVMFTRNGLTVMAVIRDRSCDRELPGGSLGIGILHNESLPLDVGLTCQTVTPTKLLPSRSVVTLIWTRHFGMEGFLSGGRMTWNEVRDSELQECDSRTIPESIETPHGEV